MNGHEADADERVGGALDAAAVRAFHDRLDDAIDTTTDLLAEIRACEELKNALAARQARAAVAVHQRQRARDLPRGITAADTARKAGADIALARRCAPHVGSRLLGLAHAITTEMPHTRTALAAGVITEWDATTLCRETTYLTRHDRAAVDAGIADQLGTTGHARLEATARAHAYRLDPVAATTRRARTETERRVTLRPAPDCMTRLTALLPVKDGVACYAALTAVADTTATPDHPRGQVMADTLVERVTGRTPTNGPATGHTNATGDTNDSECTGTGATNAGSTKNSDSDGAHWPGTDASNDRGGAGDPVVNVHLVMSLDTLTGNTPAHLPGYGPVPADLARDWITDPEQKIQVRRLFTFPGTGDLVGMDSRARTYTGLLATFIRLRDQTCRTPYCTAPIRHIDHITPAAHGGPTSERNGQGLCERCNYIREHPDHHNIGDATATLTIADSITAASHPPSPSGQPPPTRSPVERTIIDITWPHWTPPLHSTTCD